MSDDTIHFHVIQSVKGGCGKTAFSLMKSIQLAEKVQLDRDNKARVLYLDCDLCGSALKVSLCGKNSEVPTSNIGYMYLSQPFNDGRLIGFNTGYHDCKTLVEFLEQTQQVDLEDIIVHGYSYIDKGDTLNQDFVPIKNEKNITREDAYANQFNITGKIDFIFLPSEAEKKNSFNHARIHSGGDVTLNVVVFRLRMRELFQTILRYGQQIEGQSPTYTDVVLDMPPGGDVYSGELLKEIKALSSKKIDIRYYNLTTIERGHMYTTVEHIAQLLETGIEEKAIYCVFTEMVENEFARDRKGKDKTDYEKLAKNFVAIFDKSEKLFGRLKGEIHYLANRFSEVYYESTRSYEEAIRIQNKIWNLNYSELQIWGEANE